MKWNGESLKCRLSLESQIDDRNEGMEDNSDEYTDEEEYEEEYDAEDIVVWEHPDNANLKGVAPEDRELFNTFVNSGQRRNLADLITAKIEAHQNRVQFAETALAPQQPTLPPKVIEVYKKSNHNSSYWRL